MQMKAAITLAAFTLLPAFSAEAQETTDTPEVSSPAGANKGRFRFGINPTVGLESVSASGVSVSGTMVGLDLRLGWQLNDLLAIYAQPHLSFGSLSTEAGGPSISGATGTIVGTVMAEATLSDRFFGGVGAGYGILNNPSGLALEARAGVYPFMGRSANGIRRKGLMIGVDLRTVFVDGATGLLAMGCIGYEAF
jgi:hypothetical protein